MKRSGWISIYDRFPEENVYVLGKRDGVIYGGDSKEEKIVIVELIRGISLETREKMRKGEIESYLVGGYVLDEQTGFVNKLIETPRYDVYKSGDEVGNNLVPYEWETSGGESFFGQEITSWMPLPK